MLKWITLLALSLMPVLAAAAEIKVIKDYGDTVPAAPFINEIAVPNEKDLLKSINDQKDKLKESFVNASSILYPNKSQMTQGVVHKRKLSQEQFNTMPLYVIGADLDSLRWAKQNESYLKEIHAIGMITNIANEEEKQRIERETGLHLMVASLEGLEELINENHYPFLIYKGWIMQ